MREYLELVRRVRDTGLQRPDRTGVGTISRFGCQVTFDLTKGFPAVTTKRLNFRSVVAELLCFIHGEHNLADFNARGTKIWDANGKAYYWKPQVEGDLGRIYGAQWRDWQGRHMDVDQLANLLEGLTLDPYGRRHIVTAWQPAELADMCLPPCHILFQCYVPGDGTLDLRVDMRSLDLFLGFPFDIASYAILQTLIAREVGLSPGNLTFQNGDTHIYNNHISQVNEMLSRTPKALPQLVIARDKGIFELETDDIVLVNYVSHPAIAAPMAV